MGELGARDQGIDTPNYDNGMIFFAWWRVKVFCSGDLSDRRDDVSSVSSANSQRRRRLLLRRTGRTWQRQCVSYCLVPVYGTGFWRQKPQSETAVRNWPMCHHYKNRLRGFYLLRTCSTV